MFETEEEKTKFADELLREIGGFRLMAHMSFTYMCRTCNQEERIYVGVGVERTYGFDRFIASPFSVDCRYCGGISIHVNWSMDKRYAQPVQIPIGYRAFVVPEKGPNFDAMNSSCFAGAMYEHRLKS